jgi:hypothetical protein
LGNGATPPRGPAVQVIEPHVVHELLPLPGRIVAEGEVVPLWQALGKLRITSGTEYR